MVAGILSVIGFKYVSPILERSIGLMDTCGVHNLHGMPGLLGGVAAAAILLLDGAMGECGYQLLALLVTFGMAIGGGAVSGYIVSLVDTLDTEGAVNYAFNDEGAFHVEV